MPISFLANYVVTVLKPPKVASVFLAHQIFTTNLKGLFFGGDFSKKKKKGEDGK